MAQATMIATERRELVVPGLMRVTTQTNSAAPSSVSPMLNVRLRQDFRWVAMASVVAIAQIENASSAGW